MEEDETEWKSILVDSLPVSPRATTSGTVKAKGKQKGRELGFCEFQVA